MDIKTEKFFEIINDFCKDGNYKVLELEEIQGLLPRKYQFSSKDLQTMLKYLSEHDYIDVKFVDNKNLCVSTLPKGRVEMENQIKEDKTSTTYKRLFIASIVVSGLMSFIGAFVATILLK